MVVAVVVCGGSHSYYDVFYEVARIGVCARGLVHGGPDPADHAWNGVVGGTMIRCGVGVCWHCWMLSCG